MHLWLTSQRVVARQTSPSVTPTYAANGQSEAHCVQHCGGDRAAVVGVPDGVVGTEKAPLIGAHLAQVKGRQRQASCGRRDQQEEQVKEEGKCESVKIKCWEFLKLSTCRLAGTSSQMC